MKRLFQIILLIILFAYCDTAYAQQKAGIQIAPSGNPMTCFIEAKVLVVSPARIKHASASPSYKIKVKLLAVSHCGSSVPMALNPGDVIEITIMSSTRLKKGDSFRANAEERLRMGQHPQILVFSYGLNKRL